MGDMRVVTRDSTIPANAAANAGALFALDANTRQTGDFTEARSVGGKQVYLTPGGAAALDGRVSLGDRASTFDVPSGLSRLWSSDIYAKTVQHRGNS